VTARGAAAPARQLIINADDFGFTPAVTAGIVEACDVGTVTSVSMMVGLPGWDDAVREARAASGRFGIGLHFNLLVGAPMVAARSLTDRTRGTFHSLGGLIVRALVGAIDPADVAAECDAQLGALRSAGIHVTHIDSHRHTHALPGVRRAVEQIAIRERLALRQPIERSSGGLTSGRGLRAAVHAAWRLAGRADTPARHPARFTGIALHHAPAFASELLVALDSLGVGSTELMVHPGRVDAALRGLDAYQAQREVELAALCSAPVRERLRRGDFVLATFNDI
jgi:predicted glycoside hydrolase/deacetylase ChbG (UPF0249 family)